MNTKKILTALALTAALAVPFTVFAATSDAAAAKSVRGFFGVDTSKLTDQQKADMKVYSQKMADLQKDFINKMVANGTITKEQGDAEIKRIDDMIAKAGENGFLPGFGMGRGGFGGPGKMGGFEKKQIDTSKLTDAQKSDLASINKKMTDLRKDYTNKMAANGLLTKEQAENAVKRMDDMLSKAQTETHLGLFMGGFGGFHGFGMGRMDSSKLTEQQKADLDAFTESMDALRKEYVDKMVSYGLITAEQGDAITNKTAPAVKNRMEKGHMGDKKGYFNKRVNPGKSTTNGTTSAQ